jgi:hypothetical protein
MSKLDRDRLIALLERLGGSDDADVLAAGREIARHVNDAGASWDALLASPDHPAGAPPATADTTPDEPPLSDSGEKLSAEETAQAKAELAAVLAIKGISDSTRSEIEELRGDLAEGRFGRGDLRYVRALRARLS